MDSGSKGRFAMACGLLLALLIYFGVISIYNASGKTTKTKTTCVAKVVGEKTLFGIGEGRGKVTEILIRTNSGDEIRVLAPEAQEMQEAGITSEILRNEVRVTYETTTAHYRDGTVLEKRHRLISWTKPNPVETGENKEVAR